MNLNASPMRWLAVAAICLTIAWVLAACEQTTKPIPVPPELGLDIYFYNYHPQDANVNEKVYIAGRLRDGLGRLQDSVLVRFDVAPDSVGDITPWANTDTDSQTGFATQVTFNGRAPGIAIIRGEVRDGQNNLVGWDTLSIRVRHPTNG